MQVSKTICKLILIDDEQRIVEGMGQLFPWESVGFEVAGTFTSAAALEYLRTEHVAVVLSDIQMPNMTGLDLCKALQCAQGTRVVLFSSYQNYEYFRSVIQYNVADYLLIAVIGIVLLYPIIWMIFSTFKSNEEIFGSTALLCCNSVFPYMLIQFLWTYNDYFHSLIFINSVKSSPISLALRMSLDSESVVN